MSFCSYEEAWGSPYDPNSKNDHVTKKEDTEIVQSQVIENFNKMSNESGYEPGMVETAPLRGSLLGGAIPDEQWETNELPMDKPPMTLAESFEKKFDKKIDQLINSLEKCVKRNNTKKSDDNNTTWTDVLIFIALGIAAILVLDLFFKFGKWIVASQIASQVPQQVPNMQPVAPMNVPRYHYNPPPLPTKPYQYNGNVPYFPHHGGPPPRGI